MPRGPCCRLSTVDRRLDLILVTTVIPPRCGLFQQFVDECLVRHRPLSGTAADLREQARGDADGNQLLGLARTGPADTAGAFQFGVRRFRDVGEVDLAIRAHDVFPSGKDEATFWGGNGAS